MAEKYSKVRRKSENKIRKWVEKNAPTMNIVDYELSWIKENVEHFQQYSRAIEDVILTVKVSGRISLIASVDENNKICETLYHNFSSKYEEAALTQFIYEEYQGMELSVVPFDKKFADRLIIITLISSAIKVHKDDADAQLKSFNASQAIKSILKAGSK